MKGEMTIKFHKELAMIHSRHVTSRHVTSRHVTSRQNLNSVCVLSKQLCLFLYEIELEEVEAFRFWM
jgi:hypothetical protein